MSQTTASSTPAQTARIETPNSVYERTITGTDLLGTEVSFTLLPDGKYVELGSMYSRGTSGATQFNAITFNPADTTLAAKIYRAIAADGVLNKEELTVLGYLARYNGSGEALTLVLDAKNEVDAAKIPELAQRIVNEGKEGTAITNKYWVSAATNLQSYQQGEGFDITVTALDERNIPVALTLFRGKQTVSIDSYLERKNFRSEIPITAYNGTRAIGHEGQETYALFKSAVADGLLSKDELAVLGYFAREGGSNEKAAKAIRARIQDSKPIDAAEFKDLAKLAVADSQDVIAPPLPKEKARMMSSPTW